MGALQGTTESTPCQHIMSGTLGGQHSPLLSQERSTATVCVMGERSAELLQYACSIVLMLFCCLLTSLPTPNPIGSESRCCGLVCCAVHAKMVQFACC
jgi:hypothetical protein